MNPDLEAVRVFRPQRKDWQASIFSDAYSGARNRGNVQYVAVGRDGVILRFASKTTEFAMRDLVAVRVDGGRRPTVWLDQPKRKESVRGLSAEDAQTLADTLEAARTICWRRELAHRIDAFRTVHDRLANLADPAKFVCHDIIPELKRQALTATNGLGTCWPDVMSGVEEVRLL